MKKSLIALAALAASGFAMAQSSVTLFGVVDTNVTHVRGGNNWTGMDNGGNASSRLGFRGVEDLGNGLKAQFWLEGGIATDEGTGVGGGATGPGFEFKRRSTVSLMGNFGEVRLGRSTTAAYDATSRYDVFGTVGVGQSQQFGDVIRTSNMLSYYSADFSGFKFGVNYGFGEVAGETSANSYVGAGLTYDNGPLSLGLGYDRQNDRAVSLAPVATGTATTDMTRWSLGGSYNFGAAKLAAAYTNVSNKIDATGVKLKDQDYYVGLSAPVGAAGEAKIAYNRYETKFDGAKAKADQLSLGYVHNLSKRTAVYGTYAYLKNKDGALKALSTKATLKDGEKQHAVQVGVRHAF
jgi:predicted porin